MHSSTLTVATTLLALAAAAPQQNGAPAAITQNWAAVGSQADWPSVTSQWSTLSAEVSSSSAAYAALGAADSSWTSEASVTSWPTASSDWSSLTSAHPLPSDLSSLASGGNQQRDMTHHPVSSVVSSAASYVTGKGNHTSTK